MGGSSQGPSQDLGPRMACGTGGSLGSLNGSKGWDLQAVSVHWDGSVHCSGPSLRPASGVDPVSLGNTETASETPSAVVGMKPGSGHIPLQGAGKVCIDVGLHRCNCGPTPGLSWVRARTCWNRVKHPLSLRLSRRRPFPPSRCARERGSRILGFTNAHPTVRPPCPGLTPLLMVTGPPTVPADRRRVRTPRQQRVPNNRRWQFLPLVVQCFRDSEPLTAAEGGRKLAGAWAGCSADRWLEPPQAGKLGSENEDGHREQGGQAAKLKSGGRCHARLARSRTGDPARPSRHTRGPKTWDRVQGTEGIPLQPPAEAEERQLTNGWPGSWNPGRLTSRRRRFEEVEPCAGHCDPGESPSEPCGVMAFTPVDSSCPR